MALGALYPLIGFDLAIGDSAIFMDAATVVLGCLLSQPGQPFALGVGLVPKVGEEDEEDGPINPDKVNEDGELVLAGGHEVILGDVDGDNHKLCLGARQSKNRLFIGAESGNPLETLFLKATPRLPSQSEARGPYGKAVSSSWKRQAPVSEQHVSHPPNMSAAQELNSIHTPTRLVGLSEAHGGAELLKTQNNICYRGDKYCYWLHLSKGTKAGLPFT